MKMTSAGIVRPINKDDMSELLKETRETLAKDVDVNNVTNATFGELELWKMRKTSKFASASRRYL